MGYSRWDDGAYRSLVASSGRATASVQELFKSSELNAKLDPSKVKVGKGDRVGMQLRESIISEENPNPTPIILALDVTGSMNSISAQIARTEFAKMMTAIHEKGIVSDPHVMFMGFDDVHVQRVGALQVSYFEPDLRIVEQLDKMWLVNNGGGNGSESYDLPWYFAGKYTYLEGYEKQARKGFLFTFGDEPVPEETMTARELESVFGKGDYENISPAQSLKLAQEKFTVFHVCIESHSKSMRSGWENLLGSNVIYVQRSDINYLSDIVIATMAIASGQDIHEYIATAEDTVDSKKPRIKEILKHAFATTLGK